VSDSVEGVMPRNWQERPLADLVDILDNARVPVNAKEREMRQGNVPYYGATGQVGWINGHLFDEELVLLGEDGAPFFDSAKPKAYVIRGPSWVNNHAHVLRARGDIPSAFLKYQLDCVDYHPFVSGTTRPKLPQGSMRKIRLRVPPVDEQCRIVVAIDSCFSRLDAATATLERVQRNLERYRASVLKAAVEGRLVPTEAELAKKEGRSYEPADKLLQRILTERRRRWEQAELAKMKAKGKVPSDDRWKGRYEEPALPDIEALPELPEGWCWATMDQLSSMVRNGLSMVPREAAGVPILRISAVRPLKVHLDDVRFLPPPRDDYQDYLVAPGDLLFTRYNGSRSLVGVCAAFPDTATPTVHPDKLIKVQLLPGMVAGFVEIAANVGSSRRHVEMRTRTTAGQAGISGADIKQLPIPIPPSAEQERIGRVADELLSVASNTESALSVGRARVVRLRQSILKWAFEGHLVDQDPNDEPASVLLDRVRAARASTEPLRKRARNQRRSSTVK
jgi:type I restriction enzyme S subunit